MKGSNKRKSFVKLVGMNGSNFKTETLFVSFTAIITTRNGWDDTNIYIGNRVVSSMKMSRKRLACQHHCSLRNECVQQRKGTLFFLSGAGRFYLRALRTKLSRTFLLRLKEMSWLSVKMSDVSFIQSWDARSCHFFIFQQVLKWTKRGLKFSLFLFVFEGDKRLNAFVYKKNVTQSIEECKNLCVEDDCCRSINYREDSPSGEEKICELFHTVRERSWDLEDKQGYKHQKLDYPDRVRANKSFYIIL